MTTENTSALAYGSGRNVDPSCPACGQELPEITLRVSLQTNTIIHKGKRHRSRGREIEMLYVLRDAYPHLVDLEDLAKAIWGKQAKPLDWKNQLTVHASRLRPVGNWMGFRIMNKINHGYRLEIDV